VQVADTPLVLDGWACLECCSTAQRRQPQAAESAPVAGRHRADLASAVVFSDPATITARRRRSPELHRLEVGAYLYQGPADDDQLVIDDLAVRKPAQSSCE